MRSGTDQILSDPRLIARTSLDVPPAASPQFPARRTRNAPQPWALDDRVTPPEVSGGLGLPSEQR
jgi:hypothetical protein